MTRWEGIVANDTDGHRLFSQTTMVFFSHKHCTAPTIYLLHWQQAMWVKHIVFYPNLDYFTRISVNIEYKINSYALSKASIRNFRSIQALLFSTDTILRWYRALLGAKIIHTHTQVKTPLNCTKDSRTDYVRAFIYVFIHVVHFIAFFSPANLLHTFCQYVCLYLFCCCCFFFTLCHL